jgi:hypothetical protein
VRTYRQIVRQGSVVGTEGNSNPKRVRVTTQGGKSAAATTTQGGTGAAKSRPTGLQHFDEYVGLGPNHRSSQIEEAAPRGGQADARAGEYALVLVRNLATIVLRH